jgi:hypothetical protein
MTEETRQWLAFWLCGFLSGVVVGFALAGFFCF